jgi:hypothetical protein
MKDKWLLGLSGGYIVALLLNMVEIKTLTGLPAHPLFLHMPVILVPTFALVALVFALKPSWRRQYDIAYGIGGVIALAATSLTVAAGSAWEEAKRLAGSDELAAIKHHGELGETMRNVLALLVLGVIVQIAIDRGDVSFLKKHFENAKAALPVLLSVGIAGLALLAGGLTFAAGHAGAKLAWEREGGRDFQKPGQAQPGGYGQVQAPDADQDETN